MANNVGDNALHVACKTGRLKVCQFLLRSHSDLNLARNLEGNLPVDLIPQDSKEIRSAFDGDLFLCVITHLTANISNFDRKLP